MTSKITRGSLIAAGLLAATLLQPVASLAAAGDKEPVKFNFKFRQADLDTQRGAQNVHRALVYRATVVCTDSGVPTLSVHRTDLECVSKLVEQVVKQIGSDTLFAEWKRAQPSASEQALYQAAR